MEEKHDVVTPVFKTKKEMVNKPIFNYLGLMSQPPLFGFSNITQITWEITASLVDKYERRTTRTASTFVLAYPYGLPRRLFPTPFALSPEDCRKT